MNIETHDFSFEYGHAYHVLQGEQKSNNSKGRLTSPQYPFWQGSYTLRLGRTWGLRVFGGIHFVRFDEPKGSEQLKSEKKELAHHGVELLNKTGPYSRLGLFFMQQDHPLYFTKAPDEFEVIKKHFYQGGLHWALGQRRRIGLIWGLGAKGYFIFPTEGGNITTEGGVGGEGYARLGWIGPFGTTYQAKAFYQGNTAPNADVNFTHELFGYSFQVNLTF